MKLSGVYLLSATKNWGDIFTPRLFQYFGIDVDLTDLKQTQDLLWCENDEANEIGRKRDLELRSEARVFSCGSLLERVPQGFDGHILGSGMGYSDTRVNLSVKEPLLLRGPLTAERCSYGVPVRFGDPGILASIFASPYVPKSHGYGIVPHYVDKENPDVTRWTQEEGALFIDIESGIENVVDAVASCEMIVSSSLHGIVIADSLGIPCQFAKLSKLTFGDDFKIHDYYATYKDDRQSLPRTIADALALCHVHDTSRVKNDVFDVFTEFAEMVKNENSADV